MSTSQQKADINTARRKGNSVKTPAPIQVRNLAGKTITIEDVKQDLIDFTQLTNETVCRLLKRVDYDARDEFTDCTKREDSDHWFYMGSRYFIFENAIHGTQLEKAIADILPPRAKIWDFGGGVGNLSLTLAFQGYDVSFTEINSLQKDFLKFRADKYGLKINIIDPWQQKPKNAFDIVTALDVLEHIPDYRVILKELCDSVKAGGIIWEISPFLMHDNVTHRMPDCYDYKKILTDEGFTRVYGAKAGRIWQKTGACFGKYNETSQESQILNPDFENFEIAFSGSDSNMKAPVKWNITRAFEELTNANYPLALDYLDEAYSLCANVTKKQCVHAVKLLSKNNAEQLAAVVQNILGKEPDHGAVRMLAAGLNLELYFEKAMTSLRSGKSLEALNNLALIESFDPAFPNIHFAASVAYTQLDNLYPAKKACETELRLHPDHKDAKEFLRRIKEMANKSNVLHQPDICS